MKPSVIRSLFNGREKLGSKLIQSCLIYGGIMLLIVAIGFTIIDTSIEENYSQLSTVTDIQEYLAVLEKSLIDQETGQRGFALTGKDEFLEPYDDGISNFEKAAWALRNKSMDEVMYQREILHVIALGVNWSTNYGAIQVREKLKGKSVLFKDLQEGKRAFDTFRRAKTALSIQLEQRRAELRNQLLAYIPHALILMSALFVMSWVVLIFHITRRVEKIVAPIIDLDRGVSMIAKGDFSTAIPIPLQNNELASLSSNIEYMRRELKEEQEFTETVFELFRDSQQTLAPKEVYQKFGKELVSLLQCEILSIMGKNNEDDYVFKLKIINGTIIAEDEPISEEDSEVLKYIAREKSMLFSNWSRNRPNGNIPEAHYEMGMRSSIHFLITLNGKAIGIVNAISRQEGYFTAKTFRRMQRLGDLIGIALQNANAHERMKIVALKDGLTGVWNRRYFDQAIDAAIKRTNRMKEPLSLIMLDVDHFKYLNDSYGHAEGDQILIHVGQILQEYCRADNIVSRYGGEEFVVILPDTDLILATKIAERLRKLIQYDQNTFKYEVTASFGVTSFQQGDLPLAMIERADKALYAAKANGRNRVEITENELSITT